MNQATETKALETEVQHKDDETWAFEEAWQPYEVPIKKASEGDVVSADVEAVEQGEHLPPYPPPQQANTTSAPASSTNESADADVTDFDTVLQPLPAPQQLQTDKVIYLTFDDGPSRNTPKVLDILKQENVKATFFVTGHHERYVHLIKREFDEGHAIGAHSFSHKYEIYVSQEAYFKDLEKLQQVIVKYTGKRTNLIRFPGGSSNAVHRRYSDDPYFMYRLCQEVRKRGYQYIDWNLSSKDSSSSYVPASTIVTMSCRDYKHDICLLLHDSIGKETTVEALPAIIKYYKEEGYRFGILDETSSGYHHV